MWRGREGKRNFWSDETLRVILALILRVRIFLRMVLSMRSGKVHCTCYQIICWLITFLHRSLHPRVLNDAPIEKAEHYYYKHALTLLSRAPMAASKSFLNRYTDGLKETMLLPSFMQYERKRTEHRKAGQTSLSSKQSLSVSNKLARGALEIEKSRTHGDGEMEIRITPTGPADFGAAPSELFVNEAVASIRYLEGVIKLGSRSRAIYNYLASLYANLDDEEPLFRFLSTHVPAAFDLSPSNAVDLMIKHADQENSTLLDLSYVLRTILRTGRHMRSAVRLYMVRANINCMSFIMRLC